MRPPSQSHHNQSQRAGVLAALGVEDVGVGALRIVVLFWVVGWFWTARKLVYDLLTRSATAVEFALFPGPLAWGDAALVVYLLPLVALFLLLRLTRGRAYFIGLLLAFCAVFFAFHVDQFDDARWTAFFWVSLWPLLLASKLDSPAAAQVNELRWAAKLLLVLPFFAAGIGKMTDGYWSGEILHSIYFAAPGSMLFKLLYLWTSPELNRQLALYFSRATVLVELASVGMLFLPYRWFVRVGPLLLFGIIVGTGFHSTVLSLSAPFWGMLVATLLFDDAPSKSPSAGRPSRGFIALIALTAVTFAIAIAMPLSAPLQRLWMKQHHASQENIALWAALHLIPKMYTMENQVAAVSATTDDERAAQKARALEQCLQDYQLWTQHYVGNRLLLRRCRHHLTTAGAPLVVTLRSVYRSTCLKSHMHLEVLQEADAERLTITTAGHEHCAPPPAHF